MIELSDIHKKQSDCHEGIQKLLCAALPQVMKAMKPGEMTEVQLLNKFITCLLDIIQRCQRSENGRKEQKDALVARLCRFLVKISLGMLLV